MFFLVSFFFCSFFFFFFFILTFVMNFRLLKTTYHKKHGADRICFTHHPSSVICSSRYNLESTGGEFLSVK
jgi:hypothetical protein